MFVCACGMVVVGARVDLEKVIREEEEVEEEVEAARCVAEREARV